jgi:hypothetical protein
VNATVAFVTIAVGILGIIGVLARISFQLGALIARFDGHVKISDEARSDHEHRLRLLEAVRRPA